MSLIFSFSSADGITSSSMSNRLIIRITEKIKHKKLTEEEKEYILERFDPFVRKTAHFIEYFILSILVFITLLDFNLSNKRLLIYTMLICILYATSDEIRQLFVSERAGRILDVLLDSIGSFIAVNIYLFIHKLKHKKLNKTP
jgi:VanZ family protein